MWPLLNRYLIEVNKHLYLQINNNFKLLKFKNYDQQKINFIRILYVCYSF